MQKMLKRAARARKSADNKSAARIRWHQKVEKIQMDDENKQRRLELDAHALREANRRKEDHLLGPLSPWRSNMANMLQDGFGLVSSSLVNNLTDQRDAVHFDKMHRNMLRVGDRVAILRGHRTFRNQIGKIKAKNEKRAEFRIESLHQVDVENEKEASKVSDESKMTPIKLERFIPASDLALVYPLPNPQNNNIPEDCIINLEDLQPINQRKDPFQDGKRVFDRIVRPQNIIIPWPKEAEPVYRDHESDTLRIDTEDETFYPRLMSPPMPPSVLDELRNKYSRMRRRHEPAFTEGLRVTDAKEAREQARAKALLPGADQPKERHVPKMSDDLAIAIGEWMVANNKAKPSSSKEVPLPSHDAPPS